MMRAWLLDEIKGVDSMRLADVERPKPGKGEVLLRVHYAALNPADYYLAQGQYPARPPMPHVLGRDGIGTVEEIGDGVERCDVGERVAILRGPVGVERWGTFAEYVTVPSSFLVHVPGGWSEQQAASAPLVYLTAYQALTQWGDIGRQDVLITGATGGVGLAALQLAKSMTNRVVCLSRSDEKRRVLTEMGADLVVDPGDPDLLDKVGHFTNGNGIGLIVDNVGGELFNQLLDVMGECGKISCVGQLAGAVPEFRTGKLFFKRLRVGGVYVGSYTREEAHANWQEVLNFLDAVNAKPIIDQEFAFDKLREAFAHLKKGPLGKVVMKVGS